tara:strand:+ start:2460 stop:2609 length:150 start_codon:yes stop_codon:yes gene_type:complete
MLIKNITKYDSSVLVAVSRNALPKSNFIIKKMLAALQEGLVETKDLVNA